MPKINEHAFSALSALEMLDLSHNMLSNDAFLGDLVALKSLKLNHNNYTAVKLSLLHDIDKVELIGNYWMCSWLIPELVQNRIHRGITFVQEEEDFGHGDSSLEEIDCYDNSNVKKHSILRHVIVVHAQDVEKENVGGEQVLLLCLA